VPIIGVRRLVSRNPGKMAFTRILCPRASRAT
jgi:hypothetical protein